MANLNASLAAEPAQLTLDNGLRLMVTPMPYARSVSMSVYLAAGSRYEPNEADAGLSHFLEHLCFKGTTRRPRPLDISVEIDALGGTMNAATNREFTVYYAKFLPEQLEAALDLLGDMLRDSRCVEHEVERERGVILEELAAVEDSPPEQADLLLDALLFPGQPHGRDVGGTEESVSAMPRDRILDYYHRQYVANAAVVSIAGAIDVETARALVERSLGEWPAGEPLDWVRHQEEPRGARSGLIEKDTEQAHLAIGVRGLSATDEDRYALDLFSVAIGEGMSSRLFARVREELGLCYDIHSFLAHLRDTGMFGVYAGVDPSNARATVHEVARELARVCRPLEQAELERAQAVVRSRVQLRMEDTRSVAALFGAQAVLGLPIVTPEETLARSGAVTLDEVERVARRVIVEGRLQLAAVGPVRDSDLEACLPPTA